MEKHASTSVSPASGATAIVQRATYHTQTGPTARGASSQQDAFAQWRQQLSMFVNQAAEVDKAIYTRIKPILDRVSQPRVTLTFGGHFSSGKSTVINAALGRPLLPVDNLPETGALCMLRSGGQDSAIVTSGSLRRPIECTTAAIQREVSLISQNGEYRREVQQVDWLDITLKNAIIPALASWIDSPGINDTIEMNERARRAAHHADVLLWVLSSHQPLSEVEMAFVAQYIAERGPTGVVFLLNVFLEQDTQQEWERFLANKLNVYKNKIADHALFMGFTSQAMPIMLVASGRAVCNKLGDGFGGPELRRFLLSFTSADHRTIHRVRLQSAAIALRVLADEVKRKVEEEQIRLAAAQAAWQRTQWEAASFKQAVEDAMSMFFNEWSRLARACGKSISDGVTASTLAHDDRYSRILSEGMKVTAGGPMDVLLQKINSAARQYGQSPLPDAAAFAALLTPPNAVIVISEQTGVGGNSAIVTAASAELGSLVPEIGTEIGTLAKAAVEGLAGAVNRSEEAVQEARTNIRDATERARAIFRRKRQAIGMLAEAVVEGLAGDRSEEAVQEAQTNIRDATERAIAIFQGKRQEAINFVLSQCVVKVPPGRQPDNSALRYMEGLLPSLSQLAEEATDLVQYSLKER